MAPVKSNITLIPMSNEEFVRRVSHLSRIPHSTMRTTTCVLFGLAITSFLGRLCIRIYTRRKLFLDDYILTAGVGGLVYATVTIIQHSFYPYLVGIIFLAPELIATIPFFSYVDVLMSSPKFRYPDQLAVAQWTAVYGVKLCFFAFFKPLVSRLRRLTVYYWACLVFTVGCFAVSVYEVFYFHRYEGEFRAVPMGASAQGRRMDTDIYLPLVGFTTALCLLDILSDLMIISIPVILVRNTQLKRSTKYGISSFLCLSIFMIICSICRAASFVDSKRLDLPARLFWQQVEASIAVIMGSITVFRTLIVSKHTSQRYEVRAPSFVKKILPKSLSGQSSGQSRSRGGTGSTEYLELPTMPSATFSGIRSFLSRSHRGDATLDNSKFDPLEADYHVHTRGGQAV